MIQNIIYLFTYFVFLFILFFQVKKNTALDKNEFFLRINSLRGLFALEIIIGHCTRYDSTLLSPLGNFMLISVGFFFFVSGFGLARSYKEKPAYINSFFMHRIVHLIVIALISWGITSVISQISPVKTDFSDIPGSVSDLALSLLHKTNWYIRELLLLYLFFFIVYRFFKSHRILIISILQIIMCVFLFITNHTRCWFASLACFTLGIILYTYYETIIAYLNSAKGVILSALIFICGTVFSLPDYQSRTALTFEIAELISAFFNNIMCIGFIFILILFLLYIKPGNIILSFFTKLSTELYLFQFIFVTIAEKMQLSVPWKIAFVLSLDIIISVVLHNLIFKRIK